MFLSPKLVKMYASTINPSPFAVRQGTLLGRGCQKARALLGAGGKSARSLPPAGRWTFRRGQHTPVTKSIPHGNPDFHSIPNAECNSTYVSPIPQNEGAHLGSSPLPPASPFLPARGNGVCILFINSISRLSTFGGLPFPCLRSTFDVLIRILARREDIHAPARRRWQAADRG